MKKLSLTMILVLHVLFPISVSADSPTVFSLNQMNQWDLMALSRSLGATTGQLERNLSSRDFRGSFTEFQSRRNRVEALERIQNEAVKFDDTRNFEILEYPIAALSYNFDQNYYDLCVSKSYSVAEVDRNTSIWSPINARVEIVWPQKYMNPRGSLGCSINSSSIGSFRSAWPGSWLNARGRLRAQIDDFELAEKIRVLSDNGELLVDFKCGYLRLVERYEASRVLCYVYEVTMRATNGPSLSRWYWANEQWSYSVIPTSE